MQEVEDVVEDFVEWDFADKATVGFAQEWLDILGKLFLGEFCRYLAHSCPLSSVGVQL
jgi:hypothetical protein